MLVAAKLLAKGQCNPRFAYSGFTRQEHDVALTCLGSRPAILQNAQLLLTADECRQLRAVQRLEPTICPSLADN